MLFCFRETKCTHLAVCRIIKVTALHCNICDVQMIIFSETLVKIILQMSLEKSS